MTDSSQHHPTPNPASNSGHTDPPISPEQPENLKSSLGRNFDRGFAIATALAVGASLIAGFWVLGSPEKQRLRALDQQRLDDLYSMAYVLYTSAQGKGAKYQLPAQLSTDSGSIDQPRLRSDPTTKQPYEYKRLTKTTYQFCATFDTDSSASALPNRPNPEKRWRHPKGRHCFLLDATMAPPSQF